jgi:antagonist of KipI
MTEPSCGPGTGPSGAGVEVLRPGPLSSLQDLGRVGHQQLGVIASGAMDEWAHRVANLLVGNLADEATLEITLMGPSLRFHQSALIAIAGADLSPRIDGQAVPMTTPVLVRAGAQLEFGRRAFGCRAYLAVHGGYAVAPVMGSRSTYLRAGFGGFAGRALRKGDLLPLADSAAAHGFARLSGRLAAGDALFAAPTPDEFVAPAHPAAQPRRLRAIEGQQWARFTDVARAAFGEAEFTISHQSDRMGCRLAGPVLALQAPLEMISEAVAFGTVQVPPDGQPIVLMADRQTTGGYPKIAAIASVDLPLLAQKVPGETVAFELIALEHARELDVASLGAYARIGASIQPLWKA